MAAARPEIKFGRTETGELKLTQLSPTLVGKYGSHHATTDVRRGEFGSKDGGKRIITTDTDAHLKRENRKATEAKYPESTYNESPHDEDTDNVDGVSGTGKSLTKGGDNDNNKLNTVYNSFE